MTTLVLVRHAKSEWGDVSLDDHARPLNERGMRDAPRMAAELAETGLRLDAILSSTALRAATTADFFGAAFGVGVERDERLYGAPAPTLLRAAVERDVPTVMVVAHDPGMSILAGQLSGRGISHMATCAVATFQWADDDWNVASALDPDEWTWKTPR